MGASDTVEELLSLQEIDLEILRITDELDTLVAEMSGLETEVEDLEQEVTRLRAQKEEAEERVRKYQRSVQAGRATLKRIETRAGSVSNMQQHFAVRTETETARRNLRMAEDEALAAMQEVETFAERLRTAEAAHTGAQTRLESRGAEVAASRSGLEDELAKHTEQKRSQEERIDGRTLRLYQSVAGGRADTALASLTADGVCGHCYTAVPKQRQADIRAGRSLAVCEGCGVILYASDPAD